MLRSRFVVLAALAAALGGASHAHAGGIDLSWSDCGAFGTAAKSFACNRSSGSMTMVASAVAPLPMADLVGANGAVSLQTATASLSPWWHIEPGGCRDGSLGASFSFLTDVSCSDPWAGTAAGTATAAVIGSNRARLGFSCAPSAPMPIDDQSEWYIAKLTIDFAKTTGVDACSGCFDPACLVLAYIQLTSPTVGTVTLCNALVRQYVTYQSVLSACPVGEAGPTPPCPDPVPALRTTWGRIKATYR